MEVGDAERGILGAKATSAMCVQSFDDSLNSAIHITYRISLRSSSLREPRYPLLRVLDRFKGLFVARERTITKPPLRRCVETSLLVEMCAY